MLKKHSLHLSPTFHYLPFYCFAKSVLTKKMIPPLPQLLVLSMQIIMLVCAVTRTKALIGEKLC